MARKVGIALVGTGFAVHTQLPAFRHIDAAEVRALVGRDSGRSADLARQHAIPVATDRLETVLERDDIDLVCISTPPDLHAPMALAALGAGKAVLCEKPMALDAAQAESMLQAARASGRLAIVDHQLRFAPSFSKLRRLVEEGYVGTPFQAQVQMLVARWLDPRRPFSWWHERRRGGGVLGALGSHAIDWVRWMFGDVEAVCASLGTCIDSRPVSGELHPRRVDADDSAAVWLRAAAAPRLRIAMLFSVVAHRGTGVRFELYGSEGVLLCDEEGRLWGSRRDGRSGSESAPLEDLSEPERLPAGLLKTIPDSIWARAFVHQASRLVEAVAAGSSRLETAAGFDDGLAVQRVLDAARASDSSRLWVECSA